MEGAFQAKMKTNEGNTRRKKNNNKKLEFIQHVNIAKKKNQIIINRNVGGDQM